MNFGNAVMTAAILRGLYVALGTGISTALLVWATTDDWKPVIIAGATSALAALGLVSKVSMTPIARRPETSTQAMCLLQVPRLKSSPPTLSAQSPSPVASKPLTACEGVSHARFQ
jgi:hypothetical protein